jgi:hypothetical protein
MLYFVLVLVIIDAWLAAQHFENTITAHRACLNCRQITTALLVALIVYPVLAVWREGIRRRSKIVGSAR